MNEWVFDSPSIHKMNAFVAGSRHASTIQEFEIDIQKLNWASYSKNFGYGIKCYILKEEASLPSIGYNDVVQRMVQLKGRDLLPWNRQGLPV